MKTAKLLSASDTAKLFHLSKEHQLIFTCYGALAHDLASSIRCIVSMISGLSTKGLRS
jgi:hypothetical protein